MKSSGALLSSARAAREFILAGNARVTLRSIKSGARFTYRIRASEDGKLHFVSLLTGADNESAFSYIGIIRGGAFQRTAKSKVAADTPGFGAFAWCWHRLVAADAIPEGVEVWHEGRCGRCGRALTVPESIASGIGPECAKRVSSRELERVEA